MRKKITFANYNRCMKRQPKKDILHKSLLLYRRVRHRHGHGVHSPYVFNLITKVIEERCFYYCLQDIELLRRKLHFEQTTTKALPQLAINKIIDKDDIQPKKGALLFRLVNHFKAVHILQVGVKSGLSTLYLTSHRKDIQCIALEDTVQFGAIAKHVFEKGARNPIDLRIGEYKDLAQQAFADIPKVDFIFFNTFSKQYDNIWLFNESLSYVYDGTVFVFDEIKANRKMRDFWKEVCNHPDVTVTIDLFSLGIVFFNKKLHKRNYTVYF